MAEFGFTFRSQKGFFDSSTPSLTLGEEKIELYKNFKKPSRRMYLVFSKKCNLICSYCFQKNDVKMQTKFTKEEMFFIFSEAYASFDEIVLFGGEPLLDDNRTIIEKIFLFNSGKRVVVFTNGNISKDMIDLLALNKEQIKGVVITLDGIKEIHDRLRINPTSSSFDWAIETVKTLSEIGVNTNIQVNIDERNIHGIKELIDFLCNNIKPPVHIMLNPIKYDSFSTNRYDFLCAFIDTARSYPALDIQVNSRLVRNLFSLFSGAPIQKTRCGLASTIVANFSSGFIYACPHNENSEIGFIDNRIVFSHESINSLTERTSYRNKECKICEYNYLCPYGCPFEPCDFNVCKSHVHDMLTLLFNNYELLFAVETI